MRMKMKEIDIVLIDDNEDDIEMSKKIISSIKHPINIKSFTDARKALKDIIKDSPDIVLLDLRMPGYSGLDFLEDLRNKYNKDDVQVIALSENIDNTEMLNVYSYNVLGYFFKPIVRMRFLSYLNMIGLVDDCEVIGSGECA